MGADQGELLSATEAAHYLDLPHVEQIYQIAEATGMGRRIGNQWRFTQAELADYDAQRKQLRERGVKLVRSAQLALPPDLPRANDDEIDVHAAAAILGVSRIWVYDLAKQGRLGRRHGTRWLFSRTEVEAYKATRKKAGRPRKRP